MYIPIDNGVDADNGVFDFTHHGCTVFRPNINWVDIQQGGIIVFNKNTCMEELLVTILVGDKI